MIVIADTNVLIRWLVRDDESQFQAAANLFQKTEEIVIPTTVFCEIVWVLSASYKIKKSILLETLRGLVMGEKITTQEDEIEAGLAFMEEGGDFTDGVNAYLGRNMAKGQAVFASFDRQAVRLLTEHGLSAVVPVLL